MHSMPNREPIPCVLVRLACDNCGPVRMALAPDLYAPAAIACPYCEANTPLKVLGTGSTIRILPYFELEAKLQEYSSHPPPKAGFRPLTRGQTVIFCQEANILHFAAIGDVWTNAPSISPTGMPSVSFVIGGQETGAVPHVSGVDGVAPFWCLPYEMPRPAKPSAQVPETPANRPMRKPAAKKKASVPNKSPSSPLAPN
jgi:hypothetical protein